ncbi:helix-turn-helix domain-containing protein [Thermaurantiacus tibetensis]|uniref:helix-turn-helix domain-containing protein n=1 Tax=Thermaurantiacus tibetensis TaxID=2759035 RepID=UPI00188E2503|nr:helix-turn-helix transcriptional regulator [Thermaurantiacus tibetensis]
MEFRRREGLVARVDRLTETQRQCLRLTYKHKTSKEIAPLLGLSPHSVDAHIRLAMRVLGVDSRREAALLLNEIEASQGTRRRPPTVRYEAAVPPRIIHVSEGEGPALGFPSDMSNMATTHEHPAGISVMNTPVELPRSAGAVSSPTAKEKVCRQNYRSRLTHVTIEKKVLIIVLTAFLSAMAFVTVISGFAALSLLLTGETSAR